MKRRITESLMTKGLRKRAQFTFGVSGSLIAQGGALQNAVLVHDRRVSLPVALELRAELVDLHSLFLKLFEPCLLNLSLRRTRVGHHDLVAPAGFEINQSRSLDEWQKALCDFFLHTLALFFEKVLEGSLLLGGEVGLHRDAHRLKRRLKVRTESSMLSRLGGAFDLGKRFRVLAKASQDGCVSPGPGEVLGVSQECGPRQRNAALGELPRLGQHIP